jgi:hypothetical protein
VPCGDCQDGMGGAVEGNKTYGEKTQRYRSHELRNCDGAGHGGVILTLLRPPRVMWECLNRAELTTFFLVFAYRLDVGSDNRRCETAATTAPRSLSVSFSQIRN